MRSCIGLSFLAASAQATNSILGKSYDLTQSNLWTLQGLVGLPIYSDFPQEAVVNEACSIGYRAEAQSYADTHSWAQAFQRTTGVSINISWNGLALSIGSSLSQTDDYMWWSVKQSTYMSETYVHNCQTINTNFSLYERLSDSFVQTLLR